MIDPSYTDDRCRIQKPDPRFEPMRSQVTISLTEAAVSATGTTGDGIHWPYTAVEVVAVGLIGHHIYGVRLTMTDPEGVVPTGLQVEIACRNDYYARVLAKRIGAATSICVDETDESIQDREIPF